MPKIIKIGQCFMQLFQKITLAQFLRHTGASPQGEQKHTFATGYS